MSVDDGRRDPGDGLSPLTSVRLGLDMYSLQAQGWTPCELLDFCAKWGVTVAHFSEIRFIGSLAPDNLRRVRAHADDLGVDLEIGTRSICPTAATFDRSRGDADAQLAEMVEAARLVRSPIVRCVIGNAADRRAPGGIERHIEAMVDVLKRARSRVMDAGIKVAVENHAGDMQARELKTLVEEAGREFVGVCIDSGNALWALEDPHVTLETLAPYVLTSHMRDSIVWNTPAGAVVSWTRMGDGTVGIAEYLRTYIEKCPGRAVSLEVILNGPRTFNYRDAQFWDGYRETRAWEFVRFLALADRGTPTASALATPDQTDAVRQLEDVEASLRWTKAWLKEHI